MNLYSMTGFGRGTAEANGLTATVELKTLNSKTFDCHCRLPRQLGSYEIEIRNRLAAALERGKADVAITLSRTDQPETGLSLNTALIEQYFRQLQGHFGSLSAQPADLELYKMALTWPNALQAEAPAAAASEQEWTLVQQALQTALEACLAFRSREGSLLQETFLSCIENIENHLITIEAMDAGRVEAVRERLRKAVEELVGPDGADANRFEQELLYYVEKYDIAEEKVRLKTHLNYFREVLAEGNGKKLGFLGQEIGREINTIGSKANDARLQHLVVGMKEELEKIKEQTANVL